MIIVLIGRPAGRNNQEQWRMNIRSPASAISLSPYLQL